METTLKKEYEKSKADFWKGVGQQMVVKVDWRFLETKAFELGKKGFESCRVIANLVVTLLSIVRSLSRCKIAPRSETSFGITQRGGAVHGCLDRR